MFLYEAISKADKLYLNRVIDDLAITEIFQKGISVESIKQSYRFYKEDGTIDLDYAHQKLSLRQYNQLLKTMDSNEFMLVYELGAGIGNMLPAIAISTIVSILATPFAGAVSILGHTITYSGTAVATTIGSIVGNLYIGASAAGNAKMSALIAGNDLKMSTLYGVISGLSETTLGILLGNIPELIVASDLSLVGLLKEGVEEALQTYADAGLRKSYVKRKN